ncbi:50S ribosomal protein L13 [Platysternon megacephalum]|uniref:50S ribosomal protein L13 n=1 Tax=Platysternon megacephalum TaxID=55544 RepID=A0A4D9DF46_9SAUR|nr:50S ribosomal protein L13 [Platysternon megacephalum]
MARSHDIIVFAQFSADWCGYCKKQMPVMQEFHTEDGSWLWVLVDSDHTSIKKQYHISGIPVTICFRNGREVDRIVGFKDAGSLRTFIDTHRR